MDRSGLYNKIRQHFIPSIKINVMLTCGRQMLLASASRGLTHKASVFPGSRRSWFLHVDHRWHLSCPSSFLCPGLGVLSDGDPTRGSESAGPGLPPRGATFYGDPT